VIQSNRGKKYIPVLTNIEMLAYRYKNFRVENRFADIGVELHTVKHVSNERLDRFINQIGPKFKPPLQIGPMFKPPLHICAEKPVNLLPKIFVYHRKTKSVR